MRTDLTLPELARHYNYVVFEELSRDGVFVPELIGSIVTGQPINTLIGKDGFGLITKAFNIDEQNIISKSLAKNVANSPSAPKDLNIGMASGPLVTNPSQIGNKSSAGFFSIPSENNTNTLKGTTCEVIKSRRSSI